MIERRSLPLFSHARWRLRVARSTALAGAIVAVALGLGVLGYRFLAGFGWLDSLLNAAMILAGMGPVDAIGTIAGKLFATIYALFSGIAFVGIASILIAPWAHRFLHRFHADLDEERRRSRG